jgi:hypothetical protein
MKQLEHKPTHIKCNLLKLNDELNGPQINALLNQGYQISAVIPVEDNGIPTALIILTHNQNTLHNLTLKNIAAIAIIAILLQAICIFTLNLTL